MAITQSSKIVFLRQLVQDIEKGKIGIPVFQRKYVWTEDKILSFFDSINRGYPVGTILVWAREDKPMRRRDFLSDNILPADESIKYYLLDGRQRLTTFYGCVAKDVDKPEKLKLCFNLKENEFEYPNPRKPSDFIIPISDIFDTFALIGVMRTLTDKYSKSENRLNEYLDNAKNLNYRLQEYQINQISLDYCDLDEANMVFSRINSQGTIIRRAEMLQAINYKDQPENLLVDEIERIQEELTPYGFENLSQDTILNCFYKFENKDFYSLSFNEIEKLDLVTHVEEVKDAAKRTVQFLYFNCGITDSKLLPYERQFVVLTYFFKEHPDADEQSLKELKKWFYYTTYHTIFQNSSIANIRRIAKRFEEFVRGEKNSAIDYEDTNLNAVLPSRLTLQSARAKYLILAMVKRYNSMTATDNPLKFDSIIRIGGRDIENNFATICHEDSELLADIFANPVKSAQIDGKLLHRYGLSHEMMDLWTSGHKEEYKAARREEFRLMERELWESATKDQSTKKQ